MPSPVRPTKRALDEPGVAVPSLNTKLGDVDQPIIRKAQRVPEEVEAGGAERVLSLDDRVWFKVKTTDERGVVADLESATELEVPTRGWWFAASGHRKADTPSQDFYDRLAEASARQGKGTGRVSTDHLLPSDFDYRRWKAELATLAIESIRLAVREAIARSAHDGKLWTAKTTGHTIGALVRQQDGESYLAVCAEGYYDPNVVAVILDSVPDVEPSDWIAEPGPVLGIEPSPGQITFSTMLPPPTLALILEEFDGDFL